MFAITSTLGSRNDRIIQFQLPGTSCTSMAAQRSLQYCRSPLRSDGRSFAAKERPSERRGDRQYWRDLCAAMEVHEVPGNWNWIIRSFLEPNVEVMANILKDRLAE